MADPSATSSSSSTQSSPSAGSPPTRAALFDLLTTSPSQPPPISDPRVSLRSPASPPPTPPPLDPSVSPSPQSREPSTLSEFRELEGRTKRLSRLRTLFDSIPAPSPPSSPQASTSALPDEGSLTPGTVADAAQEDERRREQQRKIYARELWRKCSGFTQDSQGQDGGKPGVRSDEGSRRESAGSAFTPGGVRRSLIGPDATAARWTAFELYAEEKERELWKVFVELDVDGDMKLKKEEVREACKRAGVEVKDSVLDAFIRDVDQNNDGVISFDEWRDFLLLLPRQTSMTEVFKYWQTHRMVRPNMSQLTQDGDVVVGRGKSGWNLLLGKAAVSAKEKEAAREAAKEAASLRKQELKNDERKWAEESETVAKCEKGKGTDDVCPSDDDEHDHDEHHNHNMFHGAGKFLLAGGLAGAVSRTATAPFDRLKVYLITSASTPPSSESPSSSHDHAAKRKAPRRNAGSIPAAVRAVMKQGGGISSFWTGNGLNVIKIFPESAIKFLSYESAKRLFAEYWDQVPDQTMISNSSRFVAGGIGGVVSQFVIYPIETLKTRVMSSTGGQLSGNALIAKTAADMWRAGGLKLFFRGLPAGLIGVFPYSAIDMSTFEGIKLAYTKWAGQEPGIPGSLAFGAFSGGVGATSVYPLNLVRTRLQAQGTPAHPQVYSGIRDAAYYCYTREGWRGFYKGLTPTLVKVVPAVAISYAVYDTSKKVLFGREDPDSHHEREPDAEES
ncbi:mitochondrial carrier [Meredithblackwellia eburnea MCA 4105]